MMRCLLLLFEKVRENIAAAAAAAWRVRDHRSVEDQGRETIAVSPHIVTPLNSTNNNNGGGIVDRCTIEVYGAPVVVSARVRDQHNAQRHFLQQQWGTDVAALILSYSYDRSTLEVMDQIKTTAAAGDGPAHIALIGSLVNHMKDYPACCTVQQVAVDAMLGYKNVSRGMTAIAGADDIVQCLVNNIYPVDRDAATAVVDHRHCAACTTCSADAVKLLWWLIEPMASSSFLQVYSSYSLRKGLCAEIFEAQGDQSLVDWVEHPCMHNHETARTLCPAQILVTAIHVSVRDHHQFGVDNGVRDARLHHMVTTCTAKWNEVVAILTETEALTRQVHTALFRVRVTFEHVIHMLKNKMGAAAAPILEEMKRGNAQVRGALLVLDPLHRFHDKTTIKECKRLTVEIQRSQRDVLALADLPLPTGDWPIPELLQYADRLTQLFEPVRISIETIRSCVNDA